MRFRGGGVGHKSTREVTDFFKKDRDPSRWNASVNDEQEDSEMDSDSMEHDSEVDEDEEDDFGYVREESDNSEDEAAANGELGEEGEDDFGLEDDGGVIDPDMMGELGFSDL